MDFTAHNPPDDDSDRQAGAGAHAPLTREEATELLARRLYERMEMIDPSESKFTSWQEIEDRQREFYRCRIEGTRTEKDAWLIILQ
jgi:hypothetical protein